MTPLVTSILGRKSDYDPKNLCRIEPICHLGAVDACERELDPKGLLKGRKNSVNCV